MLRNELFVFFSLTDWISTYGNSLSSRQNLLDWQRVRGGHSFTSNERRKKHSFVDYKYCEITRWCIRDSGVTNTWEQYFFLTLEYKLSDRSITASWNFWILFFFCHFVGTENRHRCWSVSSCMSHRCASCRTLCDKNLLFGYDTCWQLHNNS